MAVLFFSIQIAALNFKTKALACVSQKTRKLLGPENFSGLFSGAFFGFRKAFLKAPEFPPKFSGMFSGNVTQGIARASISQPVIGSKIAIDIAALSWVCHVRIKFKTFSLNRPQSPTKFYLKRFVQFQQRLVFNTDSPIWATDPKGSLM